MPTTGSWASRARRPGLATRSARAGSGMGLTLAVVSAVTFGTSGAFAASLLGAG